MRVSTALLLYLSCSVAIFRAANADDSFDEDILLETDEAIAIDITDGTDATDELEIIPGLPFFSPVKMLKDTLKPPIGAFPNPFALDALRVQACAMEIFSEFMSRVKVKSCTGVDKDQLERIKIQGEIEAGEYTIGFKNAKEMCDNIGTMKWAISKVRQVADYKKTCLLVEGGHKGQSLPKVAEDSLKRQKEGLQAAEKVLVALARNLRKCDHYANADISFRLLIPKLGSIASMDMHTSCALAFSVENMVPINLLNNLSPFNKQFQQITKLFNDKIKLVKSVAGPAIGTSVKLANQLLKHLKTVTNVVRGSLIEEEAEALHVLSEDASAGDQQSAVIINTLMESVIKKMLKMALKVPKRIFSVWPKGEVCSLNDGDGGVLHLHKSRLERVKAGVEIVIRIPFLRIPLYLAIKSKTAWDACFVLRGLQNVVDKAAATVDSGIKVYKKIHPIGHIKNKVKDAVDAGALQDGANAIKDGVQNSADRVQGAKDGAENALKQGVDRIQNGVNAAKDDAENALKNGVDHVKDGANAAMDGAQNDLREGADRVQDGANAAKDGAQNALREGADGVKNAANAVGDGAQNALRKTNDALEDGAVKSARAFSDVSDKLAEADRDFTETTDGYLAKLPQTQVQKDTVKAIGDAQRDAELEAAELLSLIEEDESASLLQVQSKSRVRSKAGVGWRRRRRRWIRRRRRRFINIRRRRRRFINIRRRRRRLIPSVGKYVGQIRRLKGTVRRLTAQTRRIPGLLRRISSLTRQLNHFRRIAGRVTQLQRHLNAARKLAARVPQLHRKLGAALKRLKKLANLRNVIKALQFIRTNLVKLLQKAWKMIRNLKLPALQDPFNPKKILKMMYGKATKKFVILLKHLEKPENHKACESVRKHNIAKEYTAAFPGGSKAMQYFSLTCYDTHTICLSAQAIRSARTDKKAAEAFVGI